jgi:hypothetical protein
VNYCIGGCGYWDDFRNPGPTWSEYVLEPLHPGATIAGIERPDREVCSLPACEGSSSIRKLTTSGCWQNNDYTGLDSQ